MNPIIDEIQKAVSKLPPEELSAFRVWFAEFDAAACGTVSSSRMSLWDG